MAAVLERELCSAESISSSGCSQHLKIHEDVKDYYGKRLQGTDDLVLNVCVTPGKKLAKYVQDALKDVHEEVSSRARCESTRPIIVFLMQQVDGLYITRFGMWPPRYYGCGLVIPECLEGCRVLDLGSGSGRDCYMLSKLVGEKGHVTGVDMTDEQIQVAKKFVDYHTQRFGFSKSNVDFLQGYIEKLGDIGLKDNSFDLVISNCVVNLSPDKTAVLKEAYRVLKDGGEMYFSDIYADCELPDAVRTHKILWGECLGGALWWKEFVDIAKKVGFSEPRLVAASKVPVENEELQQIVGDCKFVSATYRLFKVAAGVPRERSRVIYNGWIEGCREKLEFDINYTFTEGETVVVDEETAAILVSSRFADEFTIQSLGKVSPSSGECPPREPQSAATDPFWLSEHVAEGGTSSCSAACSVQSKGCC